MPEDDLFQPFPDYDTPEPSWEEPEPKPKTYKEKYGKGNVKAQRLRWQHKNRGRYRAYMRAYMKARRAVPPDPMGDI